MSQRWWISDDPGRELTPLRVLAVRRIAAVAAGGAACAACAVLVIGCSKASSDSAGSAEQSDASPSAAELPEFHSDPSATVPSTTAPSTSDDSTADATSAPVELAWDEAAQEKVSTLAGEVMERFARPSLDRATWWADLEPYLSAQAQADYLGVDPANVPVRRITGPIELVPLKTHLVAIAHVPTDAGLYAVTLSRSEAAPQWAVERITPPERDPD